MNKTNEIKPLLLYTMTAGLGDYIVMGDLMKKVEFLVSESRCLMAHRKNPHVTLWGYDAPQERFFDIYKPAQFFWLISKLKKAKKDGFTIFGLQMAPGSVQGFFFHSFLKKIGYLDFIVDFNLINADIITPPRGDYILDLHLNQIKKLFRVDIPDHFYHLEIPIKAACSTSVHNNDSKKKIGIHPWSRRGDLSSFIWPFEKWLETIEFLTSRPEHEVVIFGRDKRFAEFKRYIQAKLMASRVTFAPCNSVEELIKLITGLDLLLTVNTSAAHIGYALDKKMIILCGPSLDIWTPKGEGIYNIYDEQAFFPGCDKFIPDDRFPAVSRIGTERVLSSLPSLLER